MAGEPIKKILIIAGPNGAGKTTFARAYLPQDYTNFINADLIAAGLAPFNPENAAIKAGRLMLEEINECVSKGESFAFETTLSGKGYAQKIRSWKTKGYRIIIIYLGLSSVELAISRVAARVAQGGHSIPENVIRRRFEEGLRNFKDLYKPQADIWYLYDNSSGIPLLKDQGEAI